MSKYIKVIVKNCYLLLATQSHINLKNVTKISWHWIIKGNKNKMDDTLSKLKGWFFIFASAFTQSFLCYYSSCLKHANEIIRVCMIIIRSSKDTRTKPRLCSWKISLFILNYFTYTLLNLFYTIIENATIFNKLVNL